MEKKVKTLSESLIQKSKMEYGKEALDVEPDVTMEELNKKMTDFKGREIYITNADMKKWSNKQKINQNLQYGKLKEKKKINSIKLWTSLQKKS